MAGGLTDPSKGEFYQQEFDEDNAVQENYMKWRTYSVCYFKVSDFHF
jgi:hypothetical protein